MRVYILTDLEGVAGVERWDPHAYPDAGSRQWKARAVELLAGEVMAAVEGALDAGAREVLVRDGHGHGRDLPTTGWPPQVRLIRGAGRESWLPELDPSVDAFLFVGQHAREGAPDAVLPHSWSAGRPRRCWLDGREVGETGAAVALAASLGVPTVFLSGDWAAALEALELVPGLRVAEVKRRQDGRVVHLDPEEARRTIRREVRSALLAPPPVPSPPRSPVATRRSPAPDRDAPGRDAGHHTFREVFVTPPLAGLPFLAARLLGRRATRFLLERTGRWPADPAVRALVADRRTLEYRGPTVAAVLESALGRTT